MSIENLNDSDIRSMEAKINARRSEVKPSFQHYGSVKNLSDDEIRSMQKLYLHRHSKRNQSLPLLFLSIAVFVTKTKLRFYQELFL